MTSNYNMSVQEVYIEAALYGLYFYDHLKTLSQVGCPTLTSVPDLPSWVLDLSIKEDPVSLEKEADLYSVDGGERPVFEVKGRILILNAWQWDQVVSASETSFEIRSGAGISRLLDVIDIPRQPYVDSTELCTIAV